MTLVKDCWRKNSCKKYLQGNCTNNDYCDVLFRLDALYKNALLDGYQSKPQELIWDEDGTDKGNITTIKQIGENMDIFVKDGHNLNIHSSICGNGKTSSAIFLIQSYFKKIWTTCDTSKCKALFINVPRLLIALKDNIGNKNEYAEHIKENVLDADLVVWDDIGTKSITTFEAENLLSMIDARLNSHKSNIYTSNLDSRELSELLGERLASRIVGLSEDVVFYGRDKRRLSIERMNGGR